MKSSTSTPSDDKLYMTEDLEGRLDGASLESSPAPEEDFYAIANNLVAHEYKLPIYPPPPSVTVAVVFEVGGSITLDGSLSTLSFGNEGWLCTFSVDDSKCVLPLALKAAKEPMASILVSLSGECFSMFTNVDCTVSFSYGSASITVTSNEARYV